MEYNLTKESAALLSLLYLQYKVNKKTMSARESREMGDFDDLQELVNHKFLEEDTKEYCDELYNKGLLTYIASLDKFVCAELTRDAIAYMEIKKADQIKKTITAVLGSVPQIASLFALL